MEIVINPVPLDVLGIREQLRVSTREQATELFHYINSELEKLRTAQVITSNFLSTVPY